MRETKRSGDWKRPNLALFQRALKLRFTMTPHQGMAKAKDINERVMVVRGAVPSVVDAASARNMDMRATTVIPGHRELYEIKTFGRSAETQFLL